MSEVKASALGVAKNLLKQGFDNVVKEGAQGGYIQGAVKGALSMGALGGASEWAQGGSFWGGAKASAISGAGLGAGARLGNVAINGANWNNVDLNSTVSNAKGMYKDAYSKSLKEVIRLENNVKGTL